MYGEGTPGGEFLMAKSALWQTMFHVLGQVDMHCTCHAVSMDHSAVSTKHSRVMGLKITQLTCILGAQQGHVKGWRLNHDVWAPAMVVVQKFNDVSKMCPVNLMDNVMWSSAESPTFNRPLQSFSRAPQPFSGERNTVH